MATYKSCEIYTPFKTAVSLLFFAIRVRDDKYKEHGDWEKMAVASRVFP